MMFVKMNDVRLVNGDRFSVKVKELVEIVGSKGCKGFCLTRRRGGFAAIAAIRRGHLG